MVFVHVLNGRYLKLFNQNRRFESEIALLMNLTYFSEFTEQPECFGQPLGSFLHKEM